MRASRDNVTPRMPREVTQRPRCTKTGRSVSRGMSLISVPVTISPKTMPPVQFGTVWYSLVQFGTLWYSFDHFCDFLIFHCFGCKIWTVSSGSFNIPPGENGGIDWNLDDVQASYFYFFANLSKKNRKEPFETVPSIRNCTKLYQTVPRDFFSQIEINVSRERYRMWLHSENHNLRRPHGSAIVLAAHLIFRWIFSSPNCW